VKSCNGDPGSKIVPAADTAEQGSAVLSAPLNALAIHDQVTEFAELKTAASSFVNVAFVGLLDALSFGEIKRRIRVVDSTRQINDMIKTRLERETSVAARASTDSTLDVAWLANYWARKVSQRHFAKGCLAAVDDSRNRGRRERVCRRRES
jgi:hypothetical protein